MAVVRYTAKRSLVAGVDAEDVVTFDLPLRYAGLTKGREPNVFSQRALSGVREAYYYNADQRWSCATIALTSTDADDVVMFLDSVEDGQDFEFAPFNSSIDDPITWLPVVIEPGYTEGREPALDSLTLYSFVIIQRP